jgi:MoaA/NifB/PqqE/SkfB family radical SAM enzyme
MTLHPAFDLERRALDFLWLEVTSKCNLRCVHCYADSGPAAPLEQGMTFENWRQILRQASALACRKVQFIGGEPTLYPRLMDLIREARDVGFEFIEIFTNGTSLTEERLKAFHRDGVRLAVSVYGPGAGVHEQVTATSGSFARTMAGIRTALALGMTVRAGVIDAGSNSAQAAETLALLRGIGVKSVRVDRVRGIGRGAALAPNPNPREELCGACWRGRLCVTADGSAFPCVFARFCRVGEASQGLPAIVESLELKRFRTQMWLERAGRSACDPESEVCAPGCEPEPGLDYCSPDYSKDEHCEPSARRCYPNTPCHP